MVSLLVAVGLPVVTALLSKPSWSSTTKGLVLLALAAVKTFAEAFIVSGGVHFDAIDSLWTVGINFVIAVAAYFGILRGSTVISKAQGALVKDNVPKG